MKFLDWDGTTGYQLDKPTLEKQAGIINGGTGFVPDAIVEKT